MGEVEGVVKVKAAGVMHVAGLVVEAHSWGNVEVSCYLVHCDLARDSATFSLLGGESFHVSFVLALSDVGSATEGPSLCFVSLLDAIARFTAWELLGLGSVAAATLVEVLWDGNLHDSTECLAKELCYAKGQSLGSI